MGTLISIAVAVLGTGMVAYAVREVRTKGAAAALQMAAFGLMFIGASATGLVRFITTLTFNPLAWIGAGFLALAGVLFLVGQKLEGSGKAKKPKQPKQVDESESQPAVEQSKGKSSKSGGDDEDFEDIEAILRKHGIE
ncbi:hypothetical protein EF847_20495 [Actinobacteria bacterium YIM 96077]|uniref:Cellulose synthase n=1 Tax=Phytoactinopolyspora halophila TaxID=1981511 RepID=A0A329QGK0_9ACTN|nr:hypothetical protein [Phytoactinopolyspora halophila]AYY14716.1 hypothetical protein EF847_20495 [Actinobacteria bacterium YIM 96077]RAW11573.1 hypothetical protein DPM12_15955 [Phytoactinopolyspora halophila]